MIRRKFLRLATMTSPTDEGRAATVVSHPKRKYHSPLRQRRMAETRERIIAAGAGLVHELPTWDWRNLSAWAVGELAGVSERTVHRHFSTERKLRDAVLQRLVEESGVNLDRLKLEDFSEVTARTFRHGPAGNRRLDYEPSFIIRGLANLFIDLTPA